MSTVDLQTLPEDLLAMPDAILFELVNGQLVERNMGFQSSRVGARIVQKLSNFADAAGLGWVLASDAGYQCFPDDPNKVRKPDVSFIRRERLSADDEPQGYCTLAPDLAVEVVSPNDVFENLTEKVEEYFAAGVRLVWIVDPGAERVFVYYPDAPGRILRADDELTGDNVLTGFRCRVAEIFRSPAAAPAPPPQS